MSFDSNYNQLSNPPNRSQNIRNWVYSGRDVVSFEPYPRFPTQSENEFTGLNVTNLVPQTIQDAMSIECSGELGVT